MKISHKLIACFLAFSFTAGIAWADNPSTDDLRNEVKKGNVDMIAPYAIRLFQGMDCRVDYKQSLEMFTLASKHNIPAGKYGLGLCKFYGIGGCDWNEAYNYFLGAYEGTQTEATIPLALCYENGYGVSSSYHKAFELAYNLGTKDLEARCLLMDLFNPNRTPFPRDGREVCENANQMVSMLRETNWNLTELTPTIFDAIVKNKENCSDIIKDYLAKNKGPKWDDPSSKELYNWGCLYELADKIGVGDGKKTKDRMYDFYKRSAKNGFMPAELALARLGACNGDSKSMKKLRDMASQGYSQAKLELIDMYSYRIAEDDSLRAEYVALLEDMVRIGWRGASTKLVEYYEGIGQDKYKAWQHLQEAAEGGEAVACYKVAEVYRTGNGYLPGQKVNVDMYKAFELMHKLCADLPRADYRDIDMSHAFTVLGNMYMFGKGCLQDKNEAQEWYSVALNTVQGEESKIEARYRLGCLYVANQDTKQMGIDMLRTVRDSQNPQWSKGALHILQTLRVK